MYAAVPRIIPACVIAGVVIVGDIASVGSIAFVSPKSSTFAVPSLRTLTFAGLQIAMDDVLLVRRLQRLRDLLRVGECFVEWDRALRDALRQVVTLDEFHHEVCRPADFSTHRSPRRGDDSATRGSSPRARTAPG